MAGRAFPTQLVDQPAPARHAKRDFRRGPSVLGARLRDRSQRCSTDQALIAAACALTCWLVAACAGAAGAAERWSLRGAGWGHGVGMSQYGAYGYARHGFGYRDILAHYYTGHRIERRGGRASCACCCRPNRSSVVLHRRDAGGRPRARRGLRLQGDARRPNVVLRSASGPRARALPDVMPVSGGDTVRLLGTRRQRRARRPLPRRARDPHRRRPGPERDQRARHRGLPAGRRPGREPADLAAPRRSRRRRSPRARTRSRRTSSGKGFDQYADTRSQVYRGFCAETPSTSQRRRRDRAARSSPTAAQVAVTYFFSTSGGYTENVENVFTGSDPKPWLKGVDDPYDDASPYHRWGPYTYSPRSLGAKLGSWVEGPLPRHQGAPARGLAARRAGPGRRARAAARSVTGSQLRARLGPARHAGSTCAGCRARRAPARGPHAASGTRRAGRDLTAASSRPRRASSSSSGGRRRVEDGRARARSPARQGGRYSIHVGEAGLYRVLAGWAPGPAVTRRRRESIG